VISDTGHRHRLLALFAGLVLLATLVLAVRGADAFLVRDKSFGSAGSGDGQFNDARGAAVNEATGVVYVIDAGNSRVQRFDSAGNYLSQFGSAGNGDGEFSAPRSAAVDQTDGSVYVVDAGNNRVEKFTAAGAFVKSFGSAGSDDGEFSNPQGIAVDPSSGDVYVADTGNSRVQRFSSDGAYKSKFGEAGSEDGQFNSPARVAVDSTGRIYVHEQFGRTQRFNSSGAFQLSLTGNYAWDIAVDRETDNLLLLQYTADFLKGEVAEFTAAGVPIESFIVGEINSAEGTLAFDSTGRRGYVTNYNRVEIVAEPPPLFAQKVTPFYSEAELSARVLTRGGQVEYHFEYGPTAAYGSSTATKTIAAGQTAPVRIKARLLKLQENTIYYFRAVIVNGEGQIEGVDQAFTTLGRPGVDSCPNADIRGEQGATQVGACRAFEMVSPAYKNGGDVQLAANRSSLDGEAMVFQARTGFAGGEGNARVNELISQRTPSGWETRSLTPYLTPPSEFFLPSHGYEDFSPDLAASVLISNHPPYEKTSDPSGDQNRLYHRSAAGSYSSVSPQAANPGAFIQPTYVGASRDMSRVFFESDRHLLPTAPPEGQNTLYEWADGQLSLAGTLPNGEIAQGAGLARSGNPRSAVSLDGSQIITAIGGQLYLRDSEAGTTTAITLSQKTGEVGTPGASEALLFDTVVGGDGDFSQVYFASGSALTDDANVGANGQGKELYEYDIASGTLRDVIVTHDPQNENGAQLVAASGGFSAPWMGAVSNDGSHIYFRAQSKLTAEASIGAINTYVEHDGEIAYIGGISSFEEAFHISSDGRTMLRFSEDTPTEDDTGQHKAAYLYDSVTDTTTCISCIPGGVSASDAVAAGGSTGGVGFPGFPYQPRNLTPDGKRAFFETSDALVPQDTNGAADVYEWNSGQVKLVSSGRGTEGAHFIDSSVSGRDVFIGTRERLLPIDVDENVDVYDARVDGGQPLPPPSGAPCEGDACQSPPTPPNDPTPASAGLRAPGDPQPRFNKTRKKKQRKHHSKKKKTRAGKHKSGVKRHTARAHG
jgi:DNA-binding beta-propeller fold protein YncE